MKRPTFMHGALVALALAFSASAIVATITPFVGFDHVVRLVIPALSFSYLLYLFRSNDERTGRLTTLSLWSVLAVVSWWFSPPLAFYVLIHVSAIWLVRSLYFYSGLFPALLDLGLNVLSVSGFVWAITRTGSVFLGIWCFFLIQALFVVIPASVARKKATKDIPRSDNEKFDRARRQADEALQQLFTQ